MSEGAGQPAPTTAPPVSTKPAYKRVLLKLSGEALAGNNKFGIDVQMLADIAAEIAVVNRAGIELGIVVGGGNFFRGVSTAAAGMDRVSADYIGMLATVMNAMAMQQALQHIGIECRVQSAININSIVEPYIRGKAMKHLKLGRVVIFAGGTGNPLFTTDTAASLRASEIDAEIMLKATRVDGVYNADPEKNSQAQKFASLSYDSVLARGLRVMDLTAITLCRDNNLPVRVFDIHAAGNLQKALFGGDVGTLVGN
ncbi:MAG: UMP kinase [Arenicellales bacterium WSBS_2016_MAG_OTU3]